MLRITLIAVGHKMPQWINQGSIEYAKRLKEFAQLDLVEIPLIKRGSTHDLIRIQEKEAVLIQQAIPKDAYLIALTIGGQTFSSEQLVEKLNKIQLRHSRLCLLIGGPEGLLPRIEQQADECWSLSKLTYPHPLVRIILLEVLYRAFSIAANRPYHK